MSKFSAQMDIPKWPPGEASSQQAQGIWTSDRLLNSLRDGRRVWHEGELVDVTEHPNMLPPLRFLAELQDLQHDEPMATAVTEQSSNGPRTSKSYSLPYTKEILEEKFTATHRWMAATNGLMPRHPDFMANVMVGLWDYRSRLADVDVRFAENVEGYFQYCKDNDLILTHAIGDPQMDRSVSVKENPDMALRVVQRDSDGIVVRGAKQLATMAPYAHDALIYMSPTYARRELAEHVCWFSVPMNAPGLSVYTRPSMAGRKAGSSELADRFDEQDAMMFFDDVFIPFERVFLLDDAETAVEGFWNLNKWSLYAGQIRFYHRLRFTLGVARLAARAIGVESFREIKSGIGEIAQYVELVRLSLRGLLDEASRTNGGLWAPGSTLALDTFAAQISGRITEILTKISGSGAIMVPGKVDFDQPELAALINRYMGGAGIDAEEKAVVFQAVRNLTTAEFGSRLHVYELWNRGDPVRNRMSLVDSLQGMEDLEGSILKGFRW